MAEKQTGLAAFARKNTQARNEAEESAPTPTTGRRRGMGDTVAMTVRLPRADWERLHQLAVSEGVSLQELAVRGLSKVFASKGLPGIGE